MGLVLTAQGLQQGFMLMARRRVDATRSTPCGPTGGSGRSRAISMDLGMSLLVYNLMKTSLAGARSDDDGDAIDRAPLARRGGLLLRDRWRCSSRASCPR